MSLYRSDVQYAATGTCSKMARPMCGSWRNFEEGKKVVGGSDEKWLGKQSWVNPDELNIEYRVDYYWTKGPERRSESGGLIISGTVVRHCSRTPSTRALTACIEGGRVREPSHHHGKSTWF